VPTVPELGQAVREIGRVEVLRQLDAEQGADAARHACIAGEVVVQGEGIDQQVAGQFRCGELARSIPQARRQRGEQRVGDHNLAHRPHDDQRRRPAEGIVVHHARRGQPGQERPRPLDWPGQQLGEVGQVHREVHQVVGGRNQPPVHVGLVADRSDDVERHANRQQHVEATRARLHADAVERGAQARHEERLVLEHSQRRHIDGDPRPQRTPTRLPLAPDTLRQPKIGQRQRPQHQQIPP